MSPQEEPTITITFSEFLEYVLEESDRARVKRPYHAALLLAADPEERYIHVEFPGKDTSAEVPVIWRIKDWKDSSKRLARIREISEKENQWRFKRDEMLEELASCIHVLLGGDKGWAHQKADQLYTQQNVAAAKLFGCDSLQEVLDTRPESLKGKLEIRLK